MKAKDVLRHRYERGLRCSRGRSEGIDRRIGDEDHDQPGDEGGLRSCSERQAGGLELIADGEKLRRTAPRRRSWAVSFLRDRKLSKIKTTAAMAMRSRLKSNGET